jgi:hypothetical protein
MLAKHFKPSTFETRNLAASRTHSSCSPSAPIASSRGANPWTLMPNDEPRARAAVTAPTPSMTESDRAVAGNVILTD